MNNLAVVFHRTSMNASMLMSWFCCRFTHMAERSTWQNSELDGQPVRRTSADDRPPAELIIPAFSSHAAARVWIGFPSSRLAATRFAVDTHRWAFLLIIELAVSIRTLNTPHSLTCFSLLCDEISYLSRRRFCLHLAILVDIS